MEVKEVFSHMALTKKERKEIFNETLSKIGVEARKRNWTKEQATDHARAAAAARWAKQRGEPLPQIVWFGLAVYPKECKRPSRSTLKDCPTVVHWSRVKDDVIKKASEPEYQDRVKVVIQQGTPPPVGAQA
jgi:hypothetical protein